MRSISRRGFVSLAGGAASQATLASCSKKTAAPAASTLGKVAGVNPAIGSKVTSQASVVDPADASGFVLVSDAVPDAIQEIRYFTTFNFVGERISGYDQPVALVTREAGEALRVASDLVMEQGFRLKIFDAYRPQMAVDHFVRWSQDLSDERMKRYFYPELDKSVLFAQGYIAEHSGHTRGSAVDLSLFDMDAQRECDMGGTFDLFGERSHPSYTNITDAQYELRMLLRNAMLSAGFAPVSNEWWHFILEGEPYPYTYFTFPVSEERVRS